MSISPIEFAKGKILNPDYALVMHNLPEGLNGFTL